jgi:cytidine deaminase
MEGMMKKVKLPRDINFDYLKAEACLAMALAKPRRSNCPVGCAFFDVRGNIWTGANIEVRQQRSYHAEESAIINCITHDGGKIKVICIAAERELFTPCGNCMDLIMEFQEDDAYVIYVNPKTKKDAIFLASQLMPYYPTRK